MFAEDPTEPTAAGGEPPPEEGTDWQVQTGLTLREAEELLDWLEAHGVSQREAQVTPDGVVVRWRP
jgi:hypothetical protein